MSGINARGSVTMTLNSGKGDTTVPKHKATMKGVTSRSGKVIQTSNSAEADHFMEDVDASKSILQKNEKQSILEIGNWKARGTIAVVALVCVVVVWLILSR